MKVKYALAVVLVLGVSGPAFASGPACAQKISDIESQISHAKEHGNHRRISGLEKTLAAVRENCTDAALLSEKEEEISEKHEDIAELEEEILEKESEGRLDKVQKLERKLEHEQRELKILQQEVEQIKGLVESGRK